MSFMAIGLISTAVLSMLVTLVITFAHRSSGDQSALMLPGWLSLYPFLGLSVGAMCIIGIVVSSLIRRSRSNR